MKSTKQTAYKILDITPVWKVNEVEIKEAIQGPKTVSKLARDYYKAKNLDPMKEHCIIMMLDRAHKIIGFNHVSTGSVSASIVHPREVFKPAITMTASAIILIHNHPSGELRASRQDIEITKTIHEAGEILDIPLLDHIIISFQKESYCSLNEGGHIG